MPKLIGGLEEKLMEEARAQVIRAGYAAVTVRSVAAACGVGVGTVYNYFPSKDALLASFMLADWKQCLAVIEKTSGNADEPLPVMKCISEQLYSFLDKYQMLFHDEAAAAGFGKAMGRYHDLLCSQLAAPLRRFCPDDFSAVFVAEALLTWTVKGTDPQTLLPMLLKLI